MGLLDIFKKNQPEKSIPAVPKAESADLTLSEDYAESLAKTERIDTLLAIPATDRDQNWLNQFLSDLSEASFSCGNPQVIAGKDGFPYFQLLLPKKGAEFQSFVISKMMDDFLLERGFGVVINAGAESPEWVLTYGDILNLHLNGSFFSAESAFNSDTAKAIVADQEEVMVGQPSEALLPAKTRRLLRDFFELNGILEPKILLLMRKDGEGMSQELAFNITPSQFETEEHYRNMMQTVTWYLPRHYSIIGLSDEIFENEFLPL